jgi:hypothetical protein
MITTRLLAVLGQRCHPSVLQPTEGVAVLVVDAEHQRTQDQLAALLDRLIDENYLVVVDVTNAPIVDSSFMNCMLVASQIASEKGKAFRLFREGNGVPAKGGTSQ